MNIDFPTTAKIPALRRLWKQAFGDTDEFLDLFFTHGFSPDRCRCIGTEDEIHAAHYWFDCECGGQKFAYLYAVATAPSHRGKGLCRALISDMQLLAKSRGCHGLILVPQDEALAAMYRKLGFLDCTAVTEFTAPAEAPIPLRRINRQEYAALRREMLPAGGMVQEGENLAFLDAQALFFTGHSFLAAVTVEGKKLRCHELLGDPDTAYGIVGALGCTEGTFRIPGTDKPFAQYLPLQADCARPGYFGLAFD